MAECEMHAKLNRPQKISRTLSSSAGKSKGARPVKDSWAGKSSAPKKGK